MSKQKQKDHHQKHIPVLLDEVLAYINPTKNERLLDVTAGYGGHSEKILERTLKYDGSVLIDRDKTAVEFLKDKFKDQKVSIIKNDYLSASKQLLADNEKFDLILADIGVSSLHLDNKNRGFSFKEDAPLDMRMDQSQSLTAERIVNTNDKKYLIKILREYGEEKFAGRVASEIINSRPIHTTTELVNAVARALPAKLNRKTHVATKTFQALRIAVNDELEQLKQALPIWCRLLNPDGRLVVISFHSLEDAIVKKYFVSESSSKYEASLKILNKKPVSASHDEIVLNPRARSAKLRAVAKIKKQEGATYVDSST